MADEANTLILATPSLPLRGLRLAELGEAGGKGEGLLRLPPSWYPPTLIVGPATHRLRRDGTLLATFLSEGSGSEINTSALDRLRGKRTELFVRSSAAREGMDERGSFESRRSSSGVLAVESVMNDLWDEVATGVDLGFVIQPHLPVKVWGHLSNEYRLSRDTTSWIAETYVGSQRKTQSWRVNGVKAAEDSALFCANVGQIEPVLRSVARHLSSLPFRHHLEWLWDGERVWIVQADRVPPKTGHGPGDAWSPRRGVSIGPEDLTNWRVLAGDDLKLSSAWPKAAALDEFDRADLPIATVWKISGSQLIEDLASGRAIEGLTEDIELLSSGHVVVRTDVKSGNQQLMLPKTGTVSSAGQIEEFLRSTSRDLISDGVASGDVAFLAHRYLRARACAWTLAYPGDPYVEVDSMWGTPDGLAWLPHDSSWVNVDTDEVWRSINGKTDFLDINEDGDWTYLESPTEWIWRASISEDQLRTVAAGAHRLAENAGSPVLTMWFIGILDGADAECLPWYQLLHDEKETQSRGHISPTLQRRTVRTLAELDEILDNPSSLDKAVLRLVPSPELVRDSSFVNKVVEVAHAVEITVELVGSPLAHPYYLLRKAGVAVSCVGQFNQPLTRHNKLVRDNIVEQIESNGEAVVSYRAAGTERTRLLRLKVVEEAMEVLQASSLEDSTAEIADLEEVMESLRSALRIRRDDVRRVRAEKKRKRGGFSSGLVLVTSGRESPVRGDELEGVSNLMPDRRPWQVQQRSDRVVLSALPPLGGEQQTFVLHLGERELRVTYRGTQIEVRMDGVDAPQELDGLYTELE